MAEPPLADGVLVVQLEAIAELLRRTERGADAVLDPVVAAACRRLLAEVKAGRIIEPLALVDLMLEVRAAIKGKRRGDTFPQSSA